VIVTLLLGLALGLVSIAFGAACVSAHDLNLKRLDAERLAAHNASRAKASLDDVLEISRARVALQVRVASLEAALSQAEQRTKDQIAGWSQAVSRLAGVATRLRDENVMLIDAVHVQHNLRLREAIDPELAHLREEIS
jgi:hypothetical protein